jgi:hypothetical protein
MSGLYAVPIVEGKGEVKAAETLLRRIAREYGNGAFIECSSPYRIPASQFFRFDSSFENTIQQTHVRLCETMKRKFYDKGIILAFFDCDDDCPAQLGPKILEKMQAIAPPLPPNCHFLVALAYREFESWFIASAESLRGCCGLSIDATPPTFPETAKEQKEWPATRGAKEWLTKRMSRPYSPTQHQLTMTQQFSLSAAERSHSFSRLKTKILELLSPSP